MKRFVTTLTASIPLASVALIGAARADDGAALAARFGALPSVQQISLSPDGTRVAYIVPQAGGQLVYVADVAAGGEPKPIMAENEKGARLDACQWATASRLICAISFNMRGPQSLLTFTRSVAMDADGKRVVQLTPSQGADARGILQFGSSIIDLQMEGKPGTILMGRQFLANDVTGSRIGTSASGYGVEAVDIATGKRSLVERPRPEAAAFLSDGYGTIRVAGTQAADQNGYAKGEIRYRFRPSGSGDWQPLSVVRTDGVLQSGFDPYAVDRARNLVYGIENKDGYKAVYSLALDGTGKRELLLARPGIDVDQLIAIGRNRRVVGSSYATERRQAEFFDPELKRLAAGLGKALPGQPNLEYVDASEGEGKLLMIASSDTNPGMVYLYDKTSHRLEEVLPLREQLADMKLAPMRAITYPAADGTAIPAYLTLPLGSSGENLPAIVMPHGGPSARDEWGFDWLVQFFAARGYAVLQPNYRGSAGYGSGWFQKNGFQSWRTAIGDVNAAGHWLIAQGIATPDKLGIFGWSYGGYAALQTSVLEPDLFKAIVAVAPVTDLAMLRAEAARYTSGVLVAKMIGEGPQIREGSPAQNAALIKAPVLLFHGDMDQNVGVAESRVMADRLRKTQSVGYVEFANLDHQLENAAARTRMLKESDEFFRTKLKIAP